MIAITFPPLQRLMDYVFKKYRELRNHCAIRGIDVDVKDCVDCHQQAYHGNGEAKYECHNFRRVYLIRYLAAHIAQLEEPLSECIGEQMGRKTVIRAASLGGGPGIEAIALMEQLRNSDRNHEVVFDNLECEQSWRPIHTDLAKHFVRYLENVSIDPRFLQCNVTVDLQRQANRNSYNIVFVCWILSEINDQDERRDLLKHILSSTRRNGYIIVTDRTEQRLTQEIHELVEEVRGWTLVRAEKNSRGHCGVTFPQEIKDEYQPKLNFQTAYWVLRKG